MDGKDMGKFYVHGKFFDNEKEFWKFSKEWPDLPFDLEDFKREMDLRIKEAEMNNHFSEGKMTNRQAYQILRYATDWAEENEKI